MREVLEVVSVSKSFVVPGAPAVQVLRDVSLIVGQGEFVGLVGPSGCGKSTLLNIMGLAERPDHGDVVIGGWSTKESSDRHLQQLRRAELGYVFQNFNLLSTLSVLENVMVPLVLNGTRRDEASRQAEELLTRLNLAHRRDAMPFSLSGGESQRVAIARAVVHRPKVVLADEPTGSLDSNSGDLVLDLLKEQVDSGIAVVMATHSETALARCSRVEHMKDGCLAGVTGR
jgi:ABC-type lipoprotein export system ATPase subunit